MNNKQIATIALTTFIIGIFAGTNYKNDSQSSVIHKTRSGAFIIQKNIKGEEQIYQVLELPSNIPSFVTPRGEF
jgi:hypothetical protein